MGKEKIKMKKEYEIFNGKKIPMRSFTLTFTSKELASMCLVIAKGAIGFVSDITLEPEKKNNESIFEALRVTSECVKRIGLEMKIGEKSEKRKA